MTESKGEAVSLAKTHPAGRRSWVVKWLDAKRQDATSKDNVRALLQDAREVLSKELYSSSLPFWLASSIDKKNGGFFNCLDEDGSVYDTTKHMWLHCRQVWMLSKLAADKSSGSGLSTEKRAEVLAAAKHGAEFLAKHAMNEDKTRVYFSLTADGKPASLQRKLFSECFFVMAMVLYAHASGEASYRTVGLDMFAHVLDYAANPAKLGKPVLSGQTPSSPLNVPMIILNVIDEIRDASEGKEGKSLYAKEAEWCVAEILKHWHADKQCVLETVGTDGAYLKETPEGRLLNPGHAIEAGWFLLQFAAKYLPKDAPATAKLQKTAVDIIDCSFEAGWDKQFGGLIYFLDVEGHTPTQLEWSMKLWWPHTEALIALLWAYRATGRAAFVEKFLLTLDYSLRTFSSTCSGAKSGCWYGYADRAGQRTHRFIGGPYKGFFHVPRGLLFSVQLIDAILAEDITPSLVGSRAAASASVPSVTLAKDSAGSIVRGMTFLRNEGEYKELASPDGSVLSIEVSAPTGIFSFDSTFTSEAKYSKVVLVIAGQTRVEGLNLTREGSSPPVDLKKSGAQILQRKDSLQITFVDKALAELRQGGKLRYINEYR